MITLRASRQGQQRTWGTKYRPKGTIAIAKAPWFEILSNFVGEASDVDPQKMGPLRVVGTPKRVNREPQTPPNATPRPPPHPPGEVGHCAALAARYLPLGWAFGLFLKANSQTACTLKKRGSPNVYGTRIR